jgi:hypothetical protein
VHSELAQNDVDDFLKQAARNEELVLVLENKFPKGHFFRWIFVIAYYTAVNYFNAFLLKKGDKIPTTHKSYGYNIGDVELAENRFCITEEGKMDSVGQQYRQLFQWSWDVRYSPKSCLLLQKNNLAVALEYITQIRELTTKEIGYYYKKNRKGIKKKMLAH